jgi:hypothetical protein
MLTVPALSVLSLMACVGVSSISQHRKAGMRLSTAPRNISDPCRKKRPRTSNLAIRIDRHSHVTSNGRSFQVVYSRESNGMVLSRRHRRDAPSIMRWQSNLGSGRAEYGERNPVTIKICTYRRSSGLEPPTYSCHSKSSIPMFFFL